MPFQSNGALEKLSLFILDIGDPLRGVVDGVSERSVTEENVSASLAQPLNMEEFSKLIREAVKEQNRFKDEKSATSIVAETIQDQLIIVTERRSLAELESRINNLNLKGLPCYEQYKVKMTVESAAFGVCAVASAGSGGAALLGCTAAYTIGAAEAEADFNSCIKNSY